MANYNPVLIEIVVLILVYAQLFVQIGVVVMPFWMKALVAQSLDSYTFGNTHRQLQIQSDYMKYVVQIFLYIVVAYLLIQIVNGLNSLFQQTINISSLINVLFAFVLTWQVMNIYKKVSEFEMYMYGDKGDETILDILKQLETDVYNYIIVQIVAFVFLFFFQVHYSFNHRLYQEKINSATASLTNMYSSYI